MYSHKRFCGVFWLDLDFARLLVAFLRGLLIFGFGFFGTFVDRFDFRFARRVFAFIEWCFPARVSHWTEEFEKKLRRFLA